MAPPKTIPDYVKQYQLPTDFLDLPESDIEEPAVALDADHPLSHYFINSSHNTYLSGNQLYGKASPEAYRKALDGGCRCVEIDVWDGVDHSNPDRSEESGINQLTDRLHKTHLEHIEPRVLHGHTATKECSFRDVVKTIKDHAFTTTNLPLIVSLELHTSPEQQQLMVNIMHEYWTDHLVSPANITPLTPLPNLSALTNKILIKVKYADPLPASVGKESAHPASQSDSSDDESHPLPAGKSAIIPALGSMGAYTRSVHFRSFTQPEASMPTHVFSLSEAKLSALAHAPAALVAHNRNFLLRAFPKGARVDSSNLDPAPLWRLGVQFAALNLQKIDAPVMLNHALFSGTAGFVLKPEDQRGPSAAATGTLDLAVTLLAAGGLQMGHKAKAYVKVELHAEEDEARPGTGLPNEGRAREGTYKARSATTEGDFGGERVVFNGVKGVTQELTFLRVKVMHDELLRRDELLGWACYRLSRVREGVRVVKLRDAEGKVKGELLVRVEKKWTAA